MSGYYTLTKEIEEEWKPKIDAYIKSIENSENPKPLDLTMQPGLNPSRVRDLLIDSLGYEEDNFESNGWEWDYWFYFHHDTRPALTLRGTGLTSEIYLERYDDE